MHRALVVGIADYGRLCQPLPGCTNDMLGWRDYLSSALKLDGNQLRLLADSRATREAIIERIRWLLSDAKENDQRIFFLGGHGARVIRRDPISGRLQDKIDETLVTYPGASEDPEDYMIFDEDLATLVDASGFPASASLTFIFDSCHSGGMARSFKLKPLGDGPTISDGPLPRCLRMPLDIEAREFSAAVSGVRSIGELGSSTQNVPRVVIAAAKADQSAWDDRMPDNQRHGVFSFYALQTLSQNRLATLNQVIAAVSPQIAKKFPQQPELWGTKERFDQPLAR